jgi:hypothetical protein
MRQLIALGIAALVWGAVCFLFGFVVAQLRRLVSENKMLRSTVTALSSTTPQGPPVVPHQGWVASPPLERTDQEPAAPTSDLLDVPRPILKSVVTSGRHTTEPSQPQPSGRKVFVFGSPQPEQLLALKHHPPTRPGSTGWSNQQSLTPRVFGNGTDLLPRRTQHRRRRFRSRR